MVDHLLNFSQPVTLEWTWRGKAKDFSLVTIELHDDASANPDSHIVIAKDIDNSGSFVWTPPVDGTVLKKAGSGLRPWIATFW